MECVGIIKEIDGVGRIVIPKEIRELYSLFGEVELLVTDAGVLVRNPKYKLVKILENEDEVD